MFLKTRRKRPQVAAACVLALAVATGLGGCAGSPAGEPPQAAATSDATDANAAFRGWLVDVAETNSWQEGGRSACQMTATFQNMTSEPLAAWEFALPLGAEAEVSDHWNCSVASAGETLAFTPADYNAHVDAMGGVSDIGFILKADTAMHLAGTYVVDAATHEARLLSDEARAALLRSLQGAPVQPGDAVAAGKAGDAGKAGAASAASPAQTDGDTPFAAHGPLSVSGTNLVDQSGSPFQLKGVSTHGIAWYPDYINKEAFRTLRDDWGANLVRLALYTDENGGYCTDGNQQRLEALIDQGVQAATDLGMYAIIDWHVLNDQTPARHQGQAESFFQKMSAKYAGNGNVLYEICNEPNGGTSWAEVKRYAEKIIPVIRENAPDAVVIVGTPTWSQDVDQAAASPIDAQGNVMYALHFYAATHKDDVRGKLVAAHDAGLPVFISEFSICDASGNGGIDYASAAEWKGLIERYNLSYAGWNLSNKAESSSLLRPGVSATDGGWGDADLSETGLWLKGLISSS